MKVKKQDFLPVILGADENAYACARLFYERYGVISHVICSFSLAATAHSRILKREVIPNLDIYPIFATTLPRILKELKEKYGKLILISCSDYYSELAAKIAPDIEKLIENPINSEATLALFSDKASFWELSKKFNIPHPETLIASPEALFSEKINIDFPLVLKPHNSNSYDYLHAQIPNKKKVYICRNREELNEILQNFDRANYTLPVVIQKYIPGDCTSMRVVNAYCDKSGKVRLIGAAQVLLDYTDEGSIGNYMALRPIADRELCDKTADILERIGYRGFANFDIKKDPETGEYIYFELNPRQGRSSYYIRTAGANLMEAITEDVIYGKEYSGRQYAEGSGIWGALPGKLIAQKLTGNQHSDEYFDFSLKYKNDNSPLRALFLARRNRTVARKNP